MQVAVVAIIILLLSAEAEARRGHGGDRYRGRHHGGHKRPGGHHRHNSDESDESNESNEVSTNACPGAVSRKRLEASTVSAAKMELKAKLFLDRTDRYATAGRIAFHDCVGGCDGCINRNNPDNFVFMFDSLDVMDKMYDGGYKQVMSRADFYILTG